MLAVTSPPTLLSLLALKLLRRHCRQVVDLELGFDRRIALPPVIVAPAAPESAIAALTSRAAGPATAPEFDESTSNVAMQVRARDPSTRGRVRTVRAGASRRNFSA